ncbi:MAG: hypothetical protein CO132_00675 [Candidatus Kerfeldbacteria bacterium CG_4_9_14_3_um_filter_45_8]|nr:MAG: hypothetical protein CO132_00675 [Candidatus Kerfeldbacteria bacterium CG_4_9_14_3_um_filter_45_8]
MAGWGLKLIGRMGVVPFPDLVSRGLYIEDPVVMQALQSVEVTVPSSTFFEGQTERATVSKLIQTGRIHQLEVESVARVAGGFFSVMGAIVHRLVDSVDGGREAKFGWDQVFIQTLPDDVNQPGIIGLVVNLSTVGTAQVLVEARFEAMRDDAHDNVVLNATYATSWSNLHGEHGLPGDDIVRRLSELPALTSGSAGGDGGRERKHNRLTVHSADLRGDLNLPEGRYVWMTLPELYTAQQEGFTSPHLDAMLGRLYAYLTSR